MSMLVRMARTRTRRLIVIALIAFLTVAGIGVTAGIVSSSITAGAERMLDDADPAARSVAVQYARPAGLPDVDEDYRSAIEKAFAHADVDVTLLSSARVSSSVAGTGIGMLSVIVATPAVRDAVTLTEGAWPGAGEIALNAAADLDLAVGSTVTIGGTDVTVSGLWQATDVTAALWRGDPAIAAGRSADGAGPAIIGTAEAGDLGVAYDAAWLITPRSPSPAQVPVLLRALEVLPSAISDLDPQGQRSSRVSGGLEATLTRIADAGSTVTGAVVVPAAVTLVLGSIVLWLLLSGLASSRAAELGLLRARGASAVRLSVPAAAEGMLAALCGVVPALVLSFVLGGLVIGAAAALFVLLLTGLVAALAAERVSRANAARHDGGLGSLLAFVFPLLFVAIAAGLATAQFFARGGFITAGRIDLAAVAAPALLLVTGGFIIAALAGPVAAVAQRLSARTTGVIPVLPLRRIARDTRSLTAGVLSVALAAGTIMLGVALTAGGAHAQAVAQARTLAADMRVVYADESGAVSAADRLAVVSSAPGVDDATGAVVATARLGGEAVTLVAADAGWLGDSAGLVAVADIPEPASTMTLTLSAFDTAAGTIDYQDPTGTYTIVIPPATIVVKLLTQTPTGTLAQREIGRATADRSSNTIDVPTQDSERVLGILVSAESGDGYTPPAVSGDVSLTGTGSEDLGGTVDLRSVQTTERFIIADAPRRVPVIVTAPLARSLGLQTGDELTLGSGAIAPQIPVRVERVVDAVPGAGGAAVAVDLGTLTQVVSTIGGSTPNPGEIWVRTSDPERVAAELRPLLTERVTMLTPASSSATPITSVVFRAVAIAATAAVLLAVVGFAGVVAESRRARRSVVTPLRAVGVTPRMQAAADRFEAVAIATFAVLGGVVIGAAVAAVIVPTFAGVIG